MRRVSIFIGLVCILIISSACQTATDLGDVSKVEQELQVPVRAIPEDVHAKYILPSGSNSLAPQAFSRAGNLFTNGGFESGLEGWTGCSTGAIKTSTDGYQSGNALEVVPSNCFYTSTAIKPGDELTLSCFVKINSGSGWTGMGLGFADNVWNSVGEAGPTVITGSDYARYDVAATAPANSLYASMWLYSENPAVVDNCSLVVGTEPPPPPPSGENLLENAGFGFRDFSIPGVSGIRDWSIGCGGSASIFDIRDVQNDGARGASIREGACVDQALSASDVAEIRGNQVTLSCKVKSFGYAAMTIFLDGVPTTKAIPNTELYQIVSVQANAGDISNAFVSLYGGDSLAVEFCDLRVGSQIPLFSLILIGSQFRRGQPVGETVFIRLWNTGAQPLTNIRVTSDNIADCNLSLDGLIVDEQYRYECSTGPLAPGESFITNLTVTAQNPNGETVTRNRSFQIQSPVGAGNLLDNSNFVNRDANNLPTEWNKGCGGSWGMVDARFGEVLELYGGACVDQALSAEEIQALRGRNYEVSCSVKLIGSGYASMSVFLDGVVNTKVIPSTTDPNSFERITLTGTAGSDISTGFISFYSEGNATSNLTLSSCSFNIVP